MFRTQLRRAETKVLDTKAGRVSAVVSTEDVDRAGDIIRQSGWDLKSFMEHPVLVASHDYVDLRNQIGEWEEISVKNKSSIPVLIGIARYYVGEGNSQADWAFNLASKGRAAFSVGFKPDMSKAKEIENPDGIFRQSYEFNGQELLEISQVIIPANAQALQTLKNLHLQPPIAGLVDELLQEIPPTVKTPDTDTLMVAMLQKVFDHFPLLMDIFAKPFPNEHACRLRDPGDFKPDSFRRTEREHEGKKYSIIQGRLKGEETMTEQAYRYSKTIWNAGEARSHCKAHDGKFEAASEEEKLTIKAMTEAMGEHVGDCPECQKTIKEHMGAEKPVNLSLVMRQAIELALKEA